MLICPICKRKYEAGNEFCTNEGARLVSTKGPDDTADTSKVTSSASDASSTHESALRELREKLALQDKQIAQLKKDLTAAENEVARLTAAGDRSDAGARPKTIAKKSDPSSRETSLEPTEIVPPPEGAFGWLVCVSGPLVGKRFAISADGLVIGRAKKFSDAGGISISDSSVSNPHAWIGVERDRVVIKDEGSTNGTFLNDPDSDPIKKKAVLEVGDTIIVANNAAQFVFKK